MELSLEHLKSQLHSKESTIASQQMEIERLQLDVGRERHSNQNLLKEHSIQASRASFEERALETKRAQV